MFTQNCFLFLCALDRWCVTDIRPKAIELQGNRCPGQLARWAQGGLSRCPEFGVVPIRPAFPGQRCRRNLLRLGPPPKKYSHPTNDLFNRLAGRDPSHGIGIGPSPTPVRAPRTGRPLTGAPGHHNWSHGY